MCDAKTANKRLTDVRDKGLLTMIFSVLALCSLVAAYYLYLGISEYAERRTHAKSVAKQEQFMREEYNLLLEECARKCLGGHQQKERK